MKRIGMTMAAALVAGGAWLAPGLARACEGAGHGHAAPAPAKKASAARKAATQAPLDELDAVMAAKCQCGSAADCTCKKGTCECAKCKKPRRQVVDALSDQAVPAKVQDARYDASAGIFI
ncbi:metallothionein [Myxococcaceae bacterium GXIMD 01537]